MSDDVERTLRVLMHESDQLQETIGRGLNTANALYGLVLPIAFTVLAFTSDAKELHFPPGLLCAVFFGVVCATLIYNAGLWVEISRYLRFKYTVLYPQIHELGGVPRRDNMGVFLAKEHRHRGAAATLAFHAVALIVTGGVAIAGIALDWNKPWNRYVIVAEAVVLLLAGWVSVSSMREVKANIVAISRE